MSAKTTNQELLQWTTYWTNILQPDSVHWCTGDDAEYETIVSELLAAGTFRKLNHSLRPNSYLALSDPDDVARVEERTFIATKDPIDAGPTNNWRDPEKLKTEMMTHLRGAMRGRTMYVMPFSMGPLDSPIAQIGVQITDSRYVVASMRTMTRMGDEALRILGDKSFVPCVHSLGAPLLNGEQDVPWPCNSNHKFIAHFPDSKEIWSYGSGYGGNALLGKKCFALRIASTMARDDGWLAEHMLVLAVTPPNGNRRYIAAAFPSSCGKTNMAMMMPTLPGWEVQTIGDDIAWMKFGDDGRLYAINPEFGFFGVAPGTSEKTNRNAMETLRSNAIFTNVAHTSDGDVWWEGMTTEPPPGLTDWQDEPWTAGDNSPAAHPNARITVTASQCPSLAPEWEDPTGVPISAILFGGRRATNIPLVTEARDWEHGIFLGSIMSSEKTAAATGQTGLVRFDPFAMLPFAGYNIGDYFAHWLQFSKQTDPQKLPKLYWVNWFRLNEDGSFLWPGFGDNCRVLDWILRRLEGSAEAETTPIGLVPTCNEINRNGTAVTEAEMSQLLSVDPESWRDELEMISKHYDLISDRLPAELWNQLKDLTNRLEV